MRLPWGSGSHEGLEACGAIPQARSTSLAGVGGGVPSGEFGSELLFLGISYYSRGTCVAEVRCQLRPGVGGEAVHRPWRWRGASGVGGLKWTLPRAKNQATIGPHERVIRVNFGARLDKIK